MAYENQIKCRGCGISIPDCPEDADPASGLCDKCYDSGVPVHGLTVYELDTARTQGDVVVSPYSDTAGYDCMYGGMRVGPFDLDGQRYGQKSCTPMSMDAFAKMKADAMFAAHAMNNFMVLLKAMKDEHKTRASLAEKLGQPHPPWACPVCKLIAAMELLEGG